MAIGRRKILGLMILGLLLALIWFQPLNKFAEQYTESGLKRAFVTFASARAMNATISVLKSFQVGAGASIQLGAALDPLDDVVEQFSAIMLAATLSFATQRLLIDLSGAWPVSALLTALFLAWGVFYLKNRTPPRWLATLALGLLCLRLAVPTMALGSELTYQFLLASKYETSQAQIKVAEISTVEGKADESLAERAKHWWAKRTDIGALRARADGWIEHMVRLAPVFIVQTAVLPLLFLWAMLWIYRVLSARIYPRNLHAGTERHIPQ